ncbi:extracellular solute-binding protein [Paenibacillus sp. YIM B09110]|uniref:extracellular solute-binding protein n=1 Tax=Paenibacillus sp. YIM B09110 TaxID=3126102 RepID=UPI00301E417C
MRKKTGLLLSVMLCITMVLGACSGNNGGSRSESTNKPDSTGETTETSSPNQAPVPLTVFMAGNPEVDYDTNSFTKELSERLNVDLEILVNNSQVIKEKRQLSLTSGDYADVFLLDWTDIITPAEQMKLGQQGVLIPLNDLIEEHAPNIKKLIDDIPYYKEGVTAPDGNIYGLASINECYHCSYPAKMWVNTEWLKALNMELPKTTEEFRQMLVAFKNNDLNNNGTKDEVPFSSLKGEFFTYLMNAFMYSDGIAGSFLQVNDGKAELVADKPEFKEGLKYLTSLYKEGLIDPGAMTNEWDAFRSLTNRDGIAMVGAIAAMHPFVFAAGDNPINTQYAALPPLTGPAGHSTAQYGGEQIFGAAFAITNKASKEQQIAAIKLADYLASEEGTLRATFGEKDVNWVDGGDSDIDLNGSKAKFKVLSLPAEESAKLNNIWGEVGTFVKTKEFRASQAADQNELTPAGYELRLFNATKLYDGHQPQEIVPGALFIDEADLMDYGLIQTNIKKYIEENAYKFITGNKNLDKDWEEYVKGFKKLDAERYVSITQTAMDNQK